MSNILSLFPELDGQQEEKNQKKKPTKKRKSKIVVPLKQFSAEKRVFSVGDFLDFVNELLAAPGEFFVQGEITEFKTHPTGVYFSLKDKEEGRGILQCYMNPYAYRSVGFLVEDGMEIKISGVPNIYKAKGRFSFLVRHLELTGEGSLKKSYELLKKKLESEGLFERKRILPEFIQNIAVISSKTGAVIDDFRKNLAPLGFKIKFYDVRVEGAQAVGNIINGIKFFNRPTVQKFSVDETLEFQARRSPALRGKAVAEIMEFQQEKSLSSGSNKQLLPADVLIIIRGGGSLEDLQPFNNELVAREIFASKIPTICGIGHDRDIPIACLVGDYAPSTPTACAVLINKSWEKLQINLPFLTQNIFYGFEKYLRNLESFLNNLPSQFINSLQYLLKNLTAKIENYDKYIMSANPERNLRLGYSIVTGSDGKVVKDTKNIQLGEEVRIKLYKGGFISKVQNID